MAKQARCWKCDCRYVWKKETPLVGKMYAEGMGWGKPARLECPRCPGIYLESTTYLFKGETVTLDSPPEYRLLEELRSGRTRGHGYLVRR